MRLTKGMKDLINEIKSCSVVEKKKVDVDTVIAIEVYERIYDIIIHNLCTSGKHTDNNISYFKRCVNKKKLEGLIDEDIKIFALYPVFHKIDAYGDDYTEDEDEYTEDEYYGQCDNCYKFCSRKTNYIELMMVCEDSTKWSTVYVINIYLKENPIMVKSARKI